MYIISEIIFFLNNSLKSKIKILSHLVCVHIVIDDMKPLKVNSTIF